MARYKDTQYKIQKEIDSSEISDVFYLNYRKFQYTYSVIQEIMRFSCTTTRATHRALGDVEFKGYRIPANTIIVGNLWSASRKNNIWIDPDNFNPESNFPMHGTRLENASHSTFIPFSVGRRICPGKDLGMMEMFIFLTRILRHFEINEENSNCSILRATHGITREVAPFKITFTKRNL